VDICTQYGELWDIKFNTLKSQLLTFGACNPDHCSITMNNAAIPWVTKVKYLGVSFFGYTCTTVVSAVFRKLYGQFNNILSVFGGSANEMPTLHIVKTFCIPTLMYGCEAWSLSNTNSMLPGTTVFDVYFNVAGGRLHALFSSVVYDYHYHYW